MNKSTSNLLTFFGLVALYAIIFFGLFYISIPAGFVWMGISFIAWIYWIYASRKK